MTTRAYILLLFITAITGVLSLDIIAGHSYEVLTDQRREAHQNRIAIEEIQHIQKYLPLLLTVADLIIGSGETYLQDDALEEIITLKQKLDSVAKYPIVKSKLHILDEIKNQLDLIYNQIEQTGKVIESGNAESL